MNILQDFDYLKFQYRKENLHNVFGTVLDTFPHITGAAVTGQTYLWDVLQKIKHNLAYDIDPGTYLINKYVNNGRNDVYDQRKEQLPAVCYNARFNGYKDTDHLKSITNLMFLDIDDFQTKEIAIEYKQKIIAKYDWIVACNISLSKIGLHIIALVDRIVDNEDYNAKYDFISSTYFDNLLDKTSKSLTRYTVIPFDYDIYINESPSVLNIDQIITEHRKGIPSAYNSENESLISNDKEKGIRSVHKGREIIYTPYTFFSNSHINQIMNDAARNYKLKFKQEVDEKYFKDPNIPIYVREGIDVIEVRLFQLRDIKIFEGNRHNFIGALTVKMIYLNAGSPDNNDPILRRDILKFVQHINKSICSPPLTYDEVIKSYNANWKRYKEGKIDFSRYFEKKRSFWSKQSTLTANEKRKVTCKIKNEPIVEETKRRIWDAIETLTASDRKITQSQVALISGLSLSAVKKYRKVFHEYKNMLNAKTDILEIDGNVTCLPVKPNVKQATDDQVISNNSYQNINNDFFELDDTLKIENVNTETIRVSCSTGNNSHSEYSENQLELLYLRIFGTLQSKLDENKKQRVHTEFFSCFHRLPPDDKKLLSTPNKDIHDGDTFWKQVLIEQNVWNTCVKAISE